MPTTRPRLHSMLASAVDRRSDPVRLSTRQQPHVVPSISPRTAGQRVEELEVEMVRITEALSSSEQQMKYAIELICAHNLSLAQEVHSLVTKKLRLDTDEVLRGRAKITVKELDAQLEWHRTWRGQQIPRYGNKEVKVARWVTAVERYRIDAVDRVDQLRRQTGNADGLSESNFDMSEDSSATDRMDVDE